MRGTHRIRTVTLAVMVALATTAAGQQYTDPFDARRLDPMWAFRSDDDRADYAIKSGRVEFITPNELNLFADRDTSAPMLLTRPPVDDDSFSIETHLTVVNHKGALPLGGYTGLIMIRDDLRAYVWWGAVFNTAVGGDRWDGRSVRSYGQRARGSTQASV